MYENHFQDLLENDQILTTPTSEVEHYAQDWTKQFPIKASGVLFPKTHEEVESIVKRAYEKEIPLVPSGGRTGLSGGAVASHGEWVISMDKMNKILSFSKADSSLLVQSGVVTDLIHEEALKNDLYFPVEFGATGSSQIGGNVATNAGGVHVLKYGSTRDWILSLKVVTGTGETIDVNKGLVKNNTGYDLKHLFIGSEGTLGLITEVEVKLAPRPKEKSVLLLGLESLDPLLELFSYVKKSLPISAFELFTKDCINHVLKQNEHLKKPLDENPEFYVLMELEQEEGFDASEALEKVFEEGWAIDGTISQNSAQFKELWSYRELITESISHHTPYKNDVSVRVSKVPDFIKTINNTVFKEHTDLEVVIFGHIGDGNLHVNTLKPESMDQDTFVKKCESVSSLLFGELERLGGSVSAEHGIGLLKKPYLKHTRSEYEIELMKSIKKAFDPKGILNPGKIF